jgi:hypothetical protein
MAQWYSITSIVAHRPWLNVTKGVVGHEAPAEAYYSWMNKYTTAEPLKCKVNEHDVPYLFIARTWGLETSTGVLV